MYTTAGSAPRSCADVPMLRPSRVSATSARWPLTSSPRGLQVVLRDEPNPTRPDADDVRRRSVRGVGAARRRTAGNAPGSREVGARHPRGHPVYTRDLGPLPAASSRPSSSMRGRRERPPRSSGAASHGSRLAWARASWPVATRTPRAGKEAAAPSSSRAVSHPRGQGGEIAGYVRDCYVYAPINGCSAPRQDRGACRE